MSLPLAQKLCLHHPALLALCIPLRALRERKPANLACEITNKIMSHGYKAKSKKLGKSHVSKK